MAVYGNNRPDEAGKPGQDESDAEGEKADDYAEDNHDDASKDRSVEQPQGAEKECEQ